MPKIQVLWTDWPSYVIFKREEWLPKPLFKLNRKYLHLNTFKKGTTKCLDLFFDGISCAVTWKTRYSKFQDTLFGHFPQDNIYPHRKRMYKRYKICLLNTMELLTLFTKNTNGIIGKVLSFIECAVHVRKLMRKWIKIVIGDWCYLLA